MHASTPYRLAPAAADPSWWQEVLHALQRWLLPLAMLALFIPIPRMGLPVSPENCLYFAFVLWWLFGQRKTQPMPVPARTIAVIVLLFMVAQFLVKWWCYDSPISEPTLLRRVLLLAMAWQLVRTPEHFRLVAGCVVAGMLVSGVVGLFTMFKIEPVASLFYRYLEVGIQDADLLDSRANLAGQRLMGLRGSVFGFSYLSMPAFLLLYGFLADALERRATGRVAWYVVLMTLVLICMVLNAERSSFLALAVGLGLMSLRLRQPGTALLAIAPIVLGLLVVVTWNGLLLAQQEDEQNNFLSRLDHQDHGEFAARLGLALGGAMTVIDHPFSGGNEEDYQNTVGTLPVVQRFFMNRGTLPASHNSYVNAGMRAGILGWALLAALVVASLQLFRKAIQRRAPGVGALAPALEAGFVANIVNAFFHNQGVLSGETMTWAVLALGAAAVAFPGPHEQRRRAQA